MELEVVAWGLTPPTSIGFYWMMQGVQDKPHLMYVYQQRRNGSGIWCREAGKPDHSPFPIAKHPYLWWPIPVTPPISQKE